MSSGLQKKPRGRPAKDTGASLTRGQVLAVAMDLIDEKGLEAFSLRDVARTLDVYPTAIYWHFASGRNAILAEIAAAAFSDVAPTRRPEDGWQDWVRDLFHRYRSALRRHPNFAPLLGAQLVSNAGVNPMLVEKILAALTTAGFEGRTLIDAYNAVVAAMIGYVTLELAPMPKDDPAGWARELEEKVRGLSPEDYPLIGRHMDLLANKAFIVRWQSGRVNPLQGGFDLYVEMVLAGLDGILGARGAAP